MSGTLSLIELPFLAAFLLFVFRFYHHEAASSTLNPSFLLAAFTVLLAVVFVAVAIFTTPPAYFLYGFAAAGIGLFVLAITRLVRL